MPDRRHDVKPVSALQSPVVTEAKGPGASTRALLPPNQWLGPVTTVGALLSRWLRRQTPIAYLPKRGFQECGRIRYQEWTPRLEGFGVVDADEASDVLVLDAEPFQTSGLGPAEHRAVHVDRLDLAWVRVGDIDREIECAPRSLHPAVAIEQSFDLVRFGICKRITTGHLVPFRESGVEHGVRDDIGDGLVVRMHARAIGGEHEARPVAANDSGDSQAGRWRVLEESVVKVQNLPARPEELGGTRSLLTARAVRRIARRLAVAQVDDEYAQPASGQGGNRAAHDYLDVIRVGADRDHVERFPSVNLCGHSKSQPTRCGVFRTPANISPPPRERRGSRPANCGDSSQQRRGTRRVGAIPAPPLSWATGCVRTIGGSSNHLLRRFDAMQLPFTEAQFLEVFRAYNAALWPVVVGLWLVTFAFTVALLRGRAHPVALGALTAVHWAWSGVAYHAVFFTRINPAAWLFAGLFVAEAVAFLWFGVLKRRLVFDVAWTPRHVLAAVFLLYSLVYPLLVLLTGHQFPSAPLFAVPCPTTLFTAGVLLTGEASAPRSLFVIPIAWSFVGGSAALVLGMTPDLMLFAAGVCLVAYGVMPGLLRRTGLEASDRAR